ncbi:hypothetical protein [Sebaldella sp. S0638]|uniref:hypothetical protein n=1 Tax=Sebaldella sp. S0638 TaxID=2957809 RepID=UPI00209D1E74|nr:hypothetical protein [Sebaldella sp. S0638]MCP1223781.1 hypothetical protein [Sebaldella sp. S0638]
MFVIFGIKQLHINVPVYFIKILIGALFLFQIYCIPVFAYTNKRTVVLYENGIMVEVMLPDGVTNIDRLRDNHISMKLDGVYISLSIESDTVKNRLKIDEKVYKNLKKEKPDTTFYEKMPDIVIKNNKLSSVKTIYADNVTIDGFGKLNNRYIYSVYIRGNEDISLEILRKFAVFEITKTKFKYAEYPLFLGAMLFLIGMLMIISQVIKKNFWKKSTGVITDYTYGVYVITFSIIYILENDEIIESDFSVRRMGAYSYLQKEGEEVEISYSKRNPKKVDILSSKADIIEGIFILCLAMIVFYLVIFKF